LNQVRVKVKSRTIWDIIARQNLTQNELAGKIGISTGYMSQLVCGTRYPSPKLRRKLMELVPNLTFNDLFEIEEMDSMRPGE
jgi:putative transcriptional regulator